MKASKYNVKFFTHLQFRFYLDILIQNEKYIEAPDPRSVNLVCICDTILDLKDPIKYIGYNSNNSFWLRGPKIFH